MQQRAASTWYLWISRIAGGLGVICLILAVITGVANSTIFLARPSTIVLAAIALFLVAIWSLVYELRDCGIRTRS
ncbi:MAG: hypothetical protein HYX92_07545 [Chloroflexi bacterium]|nr:hypothetical protein [Chloroflexota bacterium]